MTESVVGEPMVSRFPPYPDYKTSGVASLGDIPAQWEVSRLKRVCRLVYGDSLPAAERREGDIPVYGSNGVVGTHDRANTLGPCLIIGRKGSFGEVNHSSIPVFAIDTTFFVDQRSTMADMRWLFYALRWARLDAVSKDSAIPGLDREDAYARELPVCSAEEQRAIADFLDRETAKIDTLIAEKQRLVELLEEKRAALITQAVTRGLDPSTPMKVSGIDWLGEIPAHWTVRKVTRLFKIGSGTTPRAEHAAYFGGDIPWITTSELRERVVTESARTLTALAMADYPSLKVHPVGSLVIAMYGATIGRLGLLGMDATVNQACCVFSNPRGIGEMFAFYWFQMRRPFLVSLGSGGGQPNLSQELLRAVRIPTPPTDEQQEICSFLDSETSRIDHVVGKIKAGIVQLGELRGATISAAVTGKIDVRGEVTA